MSFHYPPIDGESVKNIKVAAALAREHKGYFLESPYSNAVEELINVYVRATEASKTNSLGVEVLGSVFNQKNGDEKVSKWDVLLTESEQLYDRLKVAGAGGDGPEAMSYFRTATSLLEKIVGLRERAMGLKQVHEFQQTVLDIMDSVLDATQRTQVMEKLKNAIGE